ncbi:unnamed protein product, partial [Meganyctiphanes norvegica]
MFVDLLLTLVVGQILLLDHVAAVNHRHRNADNNNVINVDLQVNDLTVAKLTGGNSQIPKKQYKYCSKPHSRLFNIRYGLSNHPKGLVTNRKHFSHLLNDNYLFYPSHILVKRCDEKCSYIGREDANKLDCTFLTQNVQKVISASKDGQIINITLNIEE